MKILVVGNYAADRQESMLRFSSMLDAGLRERGHDVRIVQPTIVVARLVAEHSALRKWFGYIDKLLLFPRQLRRNALWADIVHIIDHSNSVYSTAVGTKPVVVTCHDLLAIRSALGEFPENDTGWTGRIYQWFIRRGLKKTPVIASVSNATRHDLGRLIGRDRSELSVVYNGLNYPYCPISSAEAAQRLAGLGISPERDYILHVGGNQWYKNRMGVLGIFGHLIKYPEASDLHLVLAGKPWTEEMREYVRAQNLGGRVVELVGVSNAELQALYSTAKGLLFPSLYEGFGWPIIEAHACGCSVFTSDRAPMNEIGGACAVYIDPLSHEQAAERVAAALANSEGGGEDAIRNAHRFTSEQMIDGYIAVYENALDAMGRVKENQDSGNNSG